MKKNIIKILMTTALLALPCAGAHSAGLKSESVIRDNVVHLNDIFTGLGSRGDKIISQGPKPGQEIVLNSRMLLRLANTHAVDWVPSTMAETVRLRAEGQIIENRTLALALDTKARENGLDDTLHFSLPEQAERIMLPPDVVADIDVVDLRLNSANSTYEADIAAPSRYNAIVKKTIRGTFEQRVDVPVLRKALPANAIIGKADIIYTPMNVKSLAPDTVLHVENLIGKQVKRLVTLNRPIRNNELMNPMMVNRGDEVLMVFKEGPLNLTAKGKVQQDGSQGDLVRVVNTSTRRTLDAIVTGDRIVTVE
ncbi:MAG: flagellar basal body P-ring formation protein FlgA [Alphaproteobacteria bacterium]|nr:flagellar basal body P-ring formation protein FlgA [Alphaproteobacteria bacterium]